MNLWGSLGIYGKFLKTWKCVIVTWNQSVSMENGVTIINCGEKNNLGKSLESRKIVVGKRSHCFLLWVFIASDSASIALYSLYTLFCHSFRHNQTVKGKLPEIFLVIPNIRKVPIKVPKRENFVGSDCVFFTFYGYLF